MPPMEITETFDAPDREAWRAWLVAHHDSASEIWLLVGNALHTHEPSISYLHAVEEALCFGWIDGIAKRFDERHRAQRFTPRRPRSHWTELNKDRARRLIASGHMTEAGARVLPDMTVKALYIPDDILQALQQDPETWNNFQQFPELYKRIRLHHIESVRDQPDIFAQRLARFVAKTRQNKQFGHMK